MAAVLKDVGKVPVVREEWMMAEMRGTREGRQALTSCGLDFWMSSVISERVGSWKEENEYVDG